MKLRNKLRIKLFSYKMLGVGTLLLSLFIAFLLQRLIETSITILLFYPYRSLYEKQFHAKSMFVCSGISIIVLTIVSLLELPLSISILFSIILTFIITTISYHVRNYMDLKTIRTKQIPYRQQVIQALNGNKSETYVYEFCNRLGFYEDYMAETIYLFLNNKIEVVAEMLDLEVSTIYRRIKKFLKYTENIDFC